MPMFLTMEMVIQGFSALSALISRIPTYGAVQLIMKITTIRACQPHSRLWSRVTARLLDFAALLKPRVMLLSVFKGFAEMHFNVDAVPAEKFAAWITPRAAQVRSWMRRLTSAWQNPALRLRHLATAQSGLACSTASWPPKCSRKTRCAVPIRHR
jgi:hypothetical protein